MHTLSIFPFSQVMFVLQPTITGYLPPKISLGRNDCNCHVAFMLLLPVTLSVLQFKVIIGGPKSATKILVYWQALT